MAVWPLLPHAQVMSPTLAGNLTPPATQLTNTSSQRPSHSSRTSTNDASTLTLATSNNCEPHRAGPASREESDDRASVYHSEREDTPLTLLVGSGRSKERPITNKKRRTEKQEQIEFLHHREQVAVHIEKLAKQQVAERELKANIILDEQRRVLLLNKQVTSSVYAKNNRKVLYTI